MNDASLNTLVQLPGSLVGAADVVSPYGRRPNLDAPRRLACLCKVAAVHGAPVVTVDREIGRPIPGVVVRPFGIAACSGCS